MPKGLLKTFASKFVLLRVWGPDRSKVKSGKRQYTELVCCEDFRWIFRPETAEVAVKYHRLFMIDSALKGQFRFIISTEQ